MKLSREMHNYSVHYRSFPLSYQLGHDLLNGTQRNTTADRKRFVRRTGSDEISLVLQHTEELLRELAMADNAHQLQLTGLVSVT